MTSVTMNNSGDWSGLTPSQTTTNWSGTTWYYQYPMYSEDKATVAFRVLKRLVDKGYISKKLDLKKFLDLVEEIVKCL